MELTRGELSVIEECNSPYIFNVHESGFTLDINTPTIFSIQWMT